MFDNFIKILSIIIACVMSERGIDEEFENQYSPSRWALGYRGNSAEIEEAFERNVTIASNEAQLSIPFEKDIRYGTRAGQYLDLFGKNLSPGASFCVYLHGGYWQSINKSISSYVAKPLYHAGIKTVVGEYDLAPKVNLETIVIEIKELADFVFSLAEKHCSGVWFVGHSAGAQLAAQLIFNEYLTKLNEKKRSLFKGVILVSGIYDLRPLLHTTINNPLNMTSKEVELYSPLLQTNNDLTIAKSMGLKVLVTLGDHDSPAFHKQSQDFTQFLTNHGISVEYSEMKNEDHFTIAEKLGDKKFELTKKILCMIKATARSTE